MKKIFNPYIKSEGYNCFGCSPNNIFGLKMEFYEKGEFICCDWQPNHNFQGYRNVLHGGIQATLMDEIASWVVQIKLKTAGVTSKLETKFRKPLMVDTNTVHLKARLLEQKRNIAIIEVFLYNERNELCAEAHAHFFMFKEDVAREQFFYPGVEQFFTPK